MITVGLLNMLGVPPIATYVKEITASCVIVTSRPMIPGITAGDIPLNVQIDKFRKVTIVWNVLVEHIELAAVYLTQESRDLLAKLYPLPPGWTLKSEHMTISFGHANETMIQALGGLGNLVHLTASHFGTIPDRVSALKINPTHLVSENETMHVTLFVSPSGTSKLFTKMMCLLPLAIGLASSGGSGWNPIRDTGFCCK